MRFAPFGNTGVNVSVLGFGAMRLPMKNGHVVEELSFDMIRRAYAAGVNYFDTGSIYCNGEGLEEWVRNDVRSIDELCQLSSSTVTRMTSSKAVSPSASFRTAASRSVTVPSD
jgi:aryl-alcohol dehydrogenase-like predicted oxidoreductase